VYRNIRYTLDRGLSITTPCGPKALDSVSLGLLSGTCQQSKPWECGNPEGISKGCGKGGKPALWLSMLSILCHFHGLLFTQAMPDLQLNQPSNAPYSPRNARRDRLSTSAFAIMHSLT